MTTTPNLLIDHIAASQAQKEVTANSAFDALDKALAAPLRPGRELADQGRRKEIEERLAKL